MKAPKITDYDLIRAACITGLFQSNREDFEDYDWESADAAYESMMLEEDGDIDAVARRVFEGDARFRPGGSLYTLRVWLGM